MSGVGPLRCPLQGPRLLALSEVCVLVTVIDWRYKYLYIPLTRYLCVWYSADGWHWRQGWLAMDVRHCMLALHTGSFILLPFLFFRSAF